MLNIDDAKALLALIESALGLSDSLNLDFVGFRLAEAREQLLADMEHLSAVTGSGSLQ